MTSSVTLAIARRGVAAVRRMNHATVELLCHRTWRVQATFPVT